MRRLAIGLLSYSYHTYRTPTISITPIVPSPYPYHTYTHLLSQLIVQIISIIHSLKSINYPVFPVVRKEN